MKKRFSLIPLISILSLNLISAYTRSYGSFNSFSPMGFYSSLDLSMIILGIIFLIIFYGFNKTIQKTKLGHNKAASTIISLVLSTFAVYGIIKSNIQIDEILYDLGFSQDIVSISIQILALFLAIVIIWKIGLWVLFLTSGFILIFVGLFDLVYERSVSIILGAVLILIGGFFWRRKAKKKLGGSGNPKVKEKRAILEVNVDGVSHNCGYGPKNTKVKIKGEAWISVANRGENKLNWVIKSAGGLNISETRGTLLSNQSKQIKLQKTSTGKTKIIVYGKGFQAWQRCTIIVDDSGSPTPTTPQQTPTKPRTDILKSKAKQLKKEADKETKPQLYKSYMYFIGYLKQYGNNEKEIMAKLNVTQSDIQYAVKKYLQ